MTWFIFLLNLFVSYKCTPSSRWEGKTEKKKAESGQKGIIFSRIQKEITHKIFCKATFPDTAFHKMREHHFLPTNHV